MNKNEKIVREVSKLVTSGSIQMVLGGVVAAVIPKNVCFVYKAACWIGTTAIAAFAGEKMDDFVDSKVDEAKECIEIVKDCINDIKENITEKEKVGA